MNADHPTLSIVTPSFNQGRYLEQTIRSVLDQPFSNLEYIIIDGGSEDHSVQIIQQYSADIAYWRSEKDRGQAHAINHGMSVATGSLLAWLNSDDLFLPDVLSRVVGVHEKFPESILLGDVIHFNVDERYAVEMHQRNVTLENMVAYWKRGWLWNQPGTFIPASVFEKVGEFSEDLRYVFDREWMCRALSAEVPIKYLGFPVAAFRLHPLSKTVREYVRWSAEQVDVTRRFRRAVPGLSEEQLLAQQALIDAAQRLSVQHEQYLDKRQAFGKLLEGIDRNPGILLRWDFWRLALRLLVPKFMFRAVKIRWLKSQTVKSPTDIQAMLLR